MADKWWVSPDSEIIRVPRFQIHVDWMSQEKKMRVPEALAKGWVRVGLGWDKDKFYMEGKKAAIEREKWNVLGMLKAEGFAPKEVALSFYRAGMDYDYLAVDNLSYMPLSSFARESVEERQERREELAGMGFSKELMSFKRHARPVRVRASVRRRRA